MKDLGITKGTYWMGKNAGVVVTDSNSNSGKDTPDSVNYYGGYLIAESMTAADAELLIDAGNTAQKCGLLPSELLKQRDELLAAIKKIQDVLPNARPCLAVGSCMNIAEAAIKSTEQ